MAAVARLSRRVSSWSLMENVGGQLLGWAKTKTMKKVKITVLKTTQNRELAG